MLASEPLPVALSSDLIIFQGLVSWEARGSEPLPRLKTCMLLLCKGKQRGSGPAEWWSACGARKAPRQSGADQAQGTLPDATCTSAGLSTWLLWCF